MVQNIETLHFLSGSGVTNPKESEIGVGTPCNCNNVIGSYQNIRIENLETLLSNFSRIFFVDKAPCRRLSRKQFVPAIFAASVFFHRLRAQNDKNHLATRIFVYFWFWQNRDSFLHSPLSNRMCYALLFSNLFNKNVDNFDFPQTICDGLFVLVFIFVLLCQLFVLIKVKWKKSDKSLLLIEAVQTHDLHRHNIWMPFRMNDKENSEKTRLFWLHTRDSILRNRRVEKKNKNTYFQRHNLQFEFFFCYHCRFDTRTHTFCIRIYCLMHVYCAGIAQIWPTYARLWAYVSLVSSWPKIVSTA